MRTFLRRQLRQIRLGGWAAVWRKLGIALLVLACVPLVLLARILRPLVWFRFGYLPSARIGHYGPNVEVYLCERDAGMLDPRIRDLFYDGYQVSNHQLQKMWSRVLPVHPIVRWLDHVNQGIFGGAKHHFQFRPDPWRDVHGLLERTAPHLVFTPDEDARGREALPSIGVPADAPFVCFHARDQAYLETVLPGNDWDVHACRNCSVHTLVPAAEALTQRGYTALRLGAIVKEPLRTGNPRIIDYASKYRTDFLDVYLGAKCAFFFGSDAGIHGIPNVFRRPVAFVNYTGLEYLHTWASYDLFIPKKIWMREQRRFMTFPEILRSPVRKFIHSNHYRDAGLEVVDNTPEEITAVVLEMDDRLKGAWRTTEEDEELQRRFWQLYREGSVNQVYDAHIGAEFLRQNRDLLD